MKSERHERDLKKPKKTGTLPYPEVFIIESLKLNDEKKRREGAILADVLRMCGKKPIYYYIRTKAELELMAKEFKISGYRYLHISCHGTKDSLETTLDPVTYKDFAEIFKDKLKNRRLFVSACSVGNESFTKLVHCKNKGIISIAAPSDNIPFDHAVAFWSSFYVKTFSIEKESMSSSCIKDVIEPLATLFSAPMHFASRNHKKKQFSSELIKGRLRPRARPL
jgi:hypothetical protein